MKNLQVNFSNLESAEPLRVTLEGYLTSMSAIDFKKDLLSIIEERNTDCYIDISSLQRMDITGVNALAMAHKSAIRNGQKIVLICKEEHPTKEIMLLTKFNQYFNFQRA